MFAAGLGDLGRFKTTYICVACNNLDARLKKKLGAVRDFSFSPGEPRSCLLSVKPNQGINVKDIGFEEARSIYISFIAEQAQLIESFDKSGYHLDDSTVTRATRSIGNSQTKCLKPSPSLFSAIQ